MKRKQSSAKGQKNYYPKKKAVKKAAKKKRPYNYYNKKKKDDGCFITTACTAFVGLGDDCIQLRTLRQFRDTYMKNNKDYRPLVELYYSIAPSIVKQIEASNDRTKIYKWIYKEINIACDQIVLLHPDLALKTYMNVITKLIHHFKLSVDGGKC